MHRRSLLLQSTGVRTSARLSAGDIASQACAGLGYLAYLAKVLHPCSAPLGALLVQM